MPNNFESDKQTLEGWKVARRHQGSEIELGLFDLISD